MMAAAPLVGAAPAAADVPGRVEPAVGGALPAAPAPPLAVEQTHGVYRQVQRSEANTPETTGESKFGAQVHCKKQCTAVA